MRVIAGEFRSRLLSEVGSDVTRETKDRIKESIFNTLSTDLYDATILDLFSGSGSLGIEGISRGSKSCTFVDNNRLAIDTIRHNIKNLGIEKISDIYHGDYNDFLTKTYKSFDIIVLDPPYSLNVLDDIIKTIARKKLLNDDGVIVCLYGKRNTLKTENNGIIEYKKKSIGVTNVSYMRWGI